MKYSNMSEPWPPITSTNSCVSLNGEFSNPRFLGDVESMKPKVDVSDVAFSVQKYIAVVSIFELDKITD